MPAPPTRPTLIQRICDPQDAVAWGEFVEVYAPIVFNFCLSKGVQQADAADVTQDVMRNVAGCIERFEYRTGQARFSSWLFSVTRNALNNFFRWRKRRPQGDGRTTVMAAADASLSEGQEWEERWELDYQRQLFEWAAGVIKLEFNPRIWEAFWRTAVEDEDAGTVAANLEMSRAAVYVAKCRCAKRLQEKIQNVGEAWEQRAIQVEKKETS